MKCEWKEVCRRIVLRSVLICTLGIALDPTDGVANQEVNPTSSCKEGIGGGRSVEPEHVIDAQHGIGGSTPP